MCNLYSLTKGQDAIRRLFRVTVDRTGNLASLPDIFPDQMAPVVRSGPEGRELTTLRWGFPSPPNVPGNRPVTNIRNTKSSYWRAWMKPEYRCLVPATSFSEYLPGKPAIPYWFALSEERPVFAFAGLWRPWTGMRGKVEGAHEVFAFLTTEANAVVGPIHPKAMPVLLTTQEEYDTLADGPCA
jgi:putative SOS response-associated peptidase YedK